MWYNTGVEILGSALAHGITEGAIRHAVAYAMVARYVDDGLLFIGASDPSGHRLLEVLGREDAGGLVIFHALPLRPSYREKYLP